MNYQPVKVPSTVFDNHLRDIAQRIADAYLLTVQLSSADIGADRRYNLVEIIPGVSHGNNPFNATPTRVERYASLPAMKQDGYASNGRSLPDCYKQFFNSQADMETYFAKIEQELEEKVKNMVDRLAEERRVADEAKKSQDANNSTENTDGDDDVDEYTWGE